MHKTIDEAVKLARELRRPLGRIDNVESAVCPPFMALSAVSDVLGKTGIKVGAQNMHWETQGAFTGEVSPAMLKGLCQYVIIGHSERRQYSGETDEDVNRKVHAALQHSLMPIVCVGESLEHNEAGQTDAFVGGQVRAALKGISGEQARGIVVAYEPIWAIGSGKAATPADANRTIGLTVRGMLADLFGEEVAQTIRIQYGGSVKPDNIVAYMSQPDIDGALVGGASLKTDDFAALVKGAAEAYATA